MGAPMLHFEEVGSVFGNYSETCLRNAQNGSRTTQNGSRTKTV